MKEYGIEFRWDPGFWDIISGEQSKEPGVQIFHDFHLKYDSIEDFIKYCKSIIGTEYYYTPQWERANIFESDQECNHCEEEKNNMKFYGQGDYIVCDNCLEDAITRIKSIYEDIIFYDEKGVLIKRIPEMSTYPPYISRGEIVICLGKSYYLSDILFCNATNFIHLINRLKTELNNIRNHGNHTCLSCFEKIMGKSARVDLKEDKMEGIQMQSCPVFHEECLRKILETLENFIEENTQKIMAKNI